MTDQPHAPFDRALIRRRLMRAASGGAETFLIDRAASDIGERLELVKRKFPIAADLGGSHGRLAASLAQTPGVGTVISMDGRGSWGGIVGDPEWLPFRPGSLDLVASVFGLGLVNDLPGALVQSMRALKPDGLFIAVLPGTGTLHELRTAFAAAEAETMGGASPHVAPFIDVRDAGALLQRAGFALPVTDTEMVTVRYDTVFGLMADLRRMGATNPLRDRIRTPLRRATLMRMAAVYAERFSDPDGRIRASFELIHMSGWSPHESQQKPLQPGSAKMRLADALKPSDTT